MHRIGFAMESSARIIQYEYDNAGRLTHIRDSQDGEEFYQYDPINRLTAVLDEKRRPVLLNVYGYMGEITSQTLADGRKLSYEYGWDENHRPTVVKFTDPNGYTIQCWQSPRWLSLLFAGATKTKMICALLGCSANSSFTVQLHDSAAGFSHIER